MLRLRPVQKDEFVSYLEYEIEVGAGEKAAAYQIDLDQARAEIRNQLTQMLSNGVETEGHFFYWVEKAEGTQCLRIGRIWFSVDEAERFAWLHSIEIDEAWRGQGLGSQLFALIESELSRRGIYSMSLHVAGINEGAYRFYRRCGYHVAAYNLIGQWDPRAVAGSSQLRLRPATGEEAESILHYASEKLASALEAVFSLDRQQAQAAAAAQIRGRQPDGLQTDGHYLYMIEPADDPPGQPSGHAWVSIDDSCQFAWLESFDLTGGAADPERFAQAFDRVQAALLAHGIHRIQLYLPGNDEPTLQRYLNHGFQIGGRHMTRRWEAPPAYPTQ
jgi:ribosomal protein S18 acetylase RimI-like enzyme